MKWLIAALVAFIASSTLLGVSVLNLRGNLKTSEEVVQKLDKDINDPKTGYVRKLEVCRADLESARQSVVTQNGAVARLTAERDASEAKGRKALEAAQRASKAADRKIAQVMASKPKSSEYCQQARELEASLRGGVK